MQDPSKCRRRQRSLSVYIAFSCAVSSRFLPTVRDRFSLPRVVALLFCLLLHACIREVVPIFSQGLLTVEENMVTMISDTCGYVLFLLLLLLVPYIESGKRNEIYILFARTFVDVK